MTTPNPSDVTADETTLRAAVEAILADHPHADTCDQAMHPGSVYPCDCWQADLRTALAAEAQPVPETLTEDERAVIKRAVEACRPCGPCDSGLPMGCNCDPEPRSVIADLLTILARRTPATTAECSTCDGTGRIAWMVESDPNVYMEPDDDGTVPCPDCTPATTAGVATTEAALSQHRREWADYIENWEGTVGPKPPTVRMIVALLRSEHLPFGVAAAITDATQTGAGQ